MKPLVQHITARWSHFSRFDALLFGCFIGLATSLLPGFLFGPDAALIGVFLYFPFHIRLMFAAFFILFSAFAREKRLGTSYSAIGGFFTYIFARKYGLFCVGWLYASYFGCWVFGIG